MKQDIKNRKDIELLVDTFYDRVLKDQTIGYIFNDIVNLDLDKHLPIMYNFWDSLLLGGRNYKGNPMSKHFEINKNEHLLAHHFKAWLKLWEQTINDLFKGTKATEAITRSKGIATLMEFKMSQHHY